MAQRRNSNTALWVPFAARGGFQNNPKHHHPSNSRWLASGGGDLWGDEKRKVGVARAARFVIKLAAVV